MAGIRDQENIDELKKRLYDRGADYVKPERHQLTDQHFDVARGWAGMGNVKPTGDKTPAVPIAGSSAAPEVNDPVLVSVPAIVNEAAVEEPLDMVKSPPKSRRYRLFILLFSLGFFILTAVFSSIYLLMGNNQISAQNIVITLSTPFSLAGGEVAEINIGLNNQNNVALESATLIVNYPPGTRSADGQNRDLFEERIPLSGLEARKATNIPLRAILFGEENEEKEIRVALEYRVQGSNGNFFKEAPPQRVRITSSPLVSQVLSINRVSSGQELEVKLTLRSNANISQRNLLVNASYPNSFTFISADPAPDFSQTGWIIGEINPDETKEITLRGRVVGLSDEEGEIQIRVGNPRNDNQFVIGSLLSQARNSYVIERPFTDITVAVNGVVGQETVLEAGRDAEVAISLTNLLPQPIFGARLELRLDGNMVQESNLILNQAQLDPTSQVIRLAADQDFNYRRVEAGETRTYNFTVRANEAQGTANFRLSLNVFAKREDEPGATEILVGTVNAGVKYSSRLTLGSQLGFDDGPFRDTGPLPPRVGQPTTYTVTMAAPGGVNDQTGGVTTFTLPEYVTWLNQTAGDGSFEYDETGRQVRWLVGDITARGRREAQFQVRVTPNATQVGRPVAVLSEQVYQATDRYTNAALRTTAPVLSSELSTELGFMADNGVVQ